MERYFFFMLPFIGIAFLIAGIIFWLHLRNAINSFMHIHGTVVKHRAVASPREGGILYRLIVQYEVDGTEYSIQSKGAYRKPKNDVTSLIEVAYDPLAPSYSVIIPNYYTSALSIISIGGLILLFCVLFFFTGVPM